MFKIVITNHGSRLSKGNSALLNSRIGLIKQFIGNSEFTVFTFHPEISYYPELKYLKDIKVSFHEVPFRFSILTLPKTIFSFLKIVFCRFLSNYLEDLKEYNSADLIISTGGDVLTEDYGLIDFINYAGNLLLGVFLKRPVVIFAETIGPFKHKVAKLIAKYLLNYTSLITVRGTVSKNYLKKLGINNPSQYLTADTAFLLEPAPEKIIKQILEKENIRDNDVLVGMTVSGLISSYGFPNLRTIREKHDEYVRVMAFVSDYIIEKLGATIVFIPSVMNSDVYVANYIYEIVKNKEKIRIIKNEYTCEEIKGIIGRCSMFIGARMHVTIFSTSICIPTIAISYSRKTWEVIGPLTGYIIDIRKGLESEDLISMINEVWCKREKIKEDLALKIRETQRKAMLNGFLLHKVIKFPRSGRSTRSDATEVR
ncbi:MAG: polysaccharide pyruvyl transferase family protein [Candidatus Jordarchaeaceae archaeon]